MSFDFGQDTTTTAIDEASEYMADAVRYNMLHEAVEKYGSVCYSEVENTRLKFITINGTELDVDPVAGLRISNELWYQSISLKSCLNYFKGCADVLPDIQTVNMLLQMKDILPKSLKINTYNDTWCIIKGGGEMIYGLNCYNEMSSNHSYLSAPVRHPKVSCIMDYYGFFNRERPTKNFVFDIRRFMDFYKIIGQHYTGDLFFYESTHDKTYGNYSRQTSFSSSVRIGYFLDNTKEDWIALVTGMLRNFAPNFIFFHFFTVLICDNMIRCGYIDGDKLYDKLAPWLDEYREEMHWTCIQIGHGTWSHYDKRYLKIEDLFINQDFPHTAEFMKFLLTTLHELLTA